MNAVRASGARRARAARGALLLGTAAAAGAACVRIETGPAGTSSLRLDGVPPSVVVGDVLRDSLGQPALLTAVAFGEGGAPVATAPVRFVYIPAGRDTLNRVVGDTALVVDSATGAVRATRTFVAERGIVAAVLGERLQVVDTVDIVPRPDTTEQDTVFAGTLRYDCTDLRTVVAQRPAPDSTRTDTLYQYNTIGPFGVLVRGDSAGVRRPVRRRLVRWTIDSGPPVPVVRLPGGTAADTVPAIGIASNAADRLLRFDTTAADGTSRVRLRIRPSGLGRDAIAAGTYTVRLRAEAQPGPVAIADRVRFVRVVLERRPVPPGNATATCQ